MLTLEGRNPAGPLGLLSQDPTPPERDQGSSVDDRSPPLPGSLWNPDLSRREVFSGEPGITGDTHRVDVELGMPQPRASSEGRRPWKSVEI
jgi:hypothetical protein